MSGTFAATYTPIRKIADEKNVNDGNTIYLYVTSLRYDVYLPESVENIVGHDSLHVIDLGSKLEFLDQTGNHHGSGCTRDAALHNIIIKIKHL